MEQYTQREHKSKNQLIYTNATVAAANPLEPLATFIDYIRKCGGEICTDEKFEQDMHDRGIELEHVGGAIEYLKRVGWLGYEPGALYDGYHEAQHLWLIEGGAVANDVPPFCGAEVMF